jgi:hypothetical protein
MLVLSRAELTVRESLQQAERFPAVQALHRDPLSANPQTGGQSDGA